MAKKYIFEKSALAATDFTIEWLESSVALQEGDNFSVNFPELYSDVEIFGEKEKRKENERKGSK